ncbi:protein LEKR1 [Elgaria multicarinata webbii]|uniref:protein LEKR1 n=1 Tax=Elgaria multicarinata webbii TaxID=159646 RepID=UPI002FCD505A
MDRHVPVHPLPEEIRKMSRDETVCKYCGVSYLILHEFKLLEEKVKAMEEKVKFYEGSVEREKTLQEKLQRLNRDFEKCTAASESKAGRMKALSLEFENKQAALQNLTEQLRCLQKEREVLYRKSQLLRKTLERHMFILKKAFVLLPFIRGELNSIKEGIFSFFNQWTALKGEVFLRLKTINITGLAENSSLNQKLGKCQTENLVLQEEVQHLRLISNAAELEAEQLQASLLRESELQNRCHELQVKTQGQYDQKISKLNSYFPPEGAECSLIFNKQKDIMTSHGEEEKALIMNVSHVQCCSYALEMLGNDDNEVKFWSVMPIRPLRLHNGQQPYLSNGQVISEKECILRPVFIVAIRNDAKKSKEVEDRRSELQKLVSEIERSESRFTHTLTEREQSLLACQQTCRRLQEEAVEKERKEGDLKKQTDHLESELETIKSLLKQREEEVVTLKQERESVLISHQNRTEQLQETLRQKVLNEKNWQEKIETDRAKEQAHHKQEILRLKEDARMELDIEKQKHQELIAKYQKDQDELLHMKIPVLLSSATNNLKMEMDTLEKKLREAQAKLTEKNHECEKEWQGLKRNLADLELQLHEERSTCQSVTEDMAEEIKKKSYELEKLTQEHTELIQNMNQVQEENALLQDTVRRECEERYELTEALAQAREQVMELKKLGGNFPLSQCSLSQGSLTSSTALVSNRGQKSPNSGKGITLSGPCMISRATNASAYNRHKSSLNVSLPALPALQLPNGRASSLDESRRRRITAVIKRQLSEL